MRGDRIPLSYRILSAVTVFLFGCFSLRSQDWQRMGTDYNGTAMTDGGRILFVGDHGGILLSEDDGSTWSAPVSGTWSHLHAVRFGSELVAVAAGDNGTLLRTTDGGKTWKDVPSPVRGSIRALDFPSGSVGYGLADSGVVIRTANSGASWDTVAQRLPGLEKGTGATFFDEYRGIIVAEGRIYLTEDGGESWGTAFTDFSLTFSGIAFVPGEAVGYAATEEGVILKTTNYGNTWERVTPLELGLAPQCVAVAADGTVYVGGKWLAGNPDPYNLLNVSTDGGQTWSRTTLYIAVSPGIAINGLAIQGEQIGLAGNGGTAMLAGLDLERSGQQVVSNSLLKNPATGTGLPLYKMAFSGPDTGIATVRIPSPPYTAFVRTTNSGITWDFASSALVQNYLEIFSFPGGEFLTFSSNGGTLYRTDNVGRTWITQNTAPTEPRLVTSRAGTLVDRQRGYVAGDSLIYQTTDSGHTWRPRYFSGISGRWSGLSAVTNLSFPTFETGYAVFVTGEGGRVIVIGTTDGGETWREVLSRNSSSAYYGLHFVNEQRGFYCEGRPWENTGVLFSTTDGGETWDSLVFDDASPLSVTFFDEMNGVVLGSPFLLLRTTDGGESWNREYVWPSEADTTGLPFTDAVLLPDERTVLLIGNGVIARKTYPDKLVSVAEEKREEAITGELVVIPNPARDRLRVVFPSPLIGQGRGVRLFDLVGRDVVGGAVPFGSSGVAEIDVSGLPAGAYRVVVEGREGNVLAVRSVMVVR